MRAANYRPQYGLSIKILKMFMTKKDLEKLIDKYVETKKKIVLGEEVKKERATILR